MFDPTAVWGAEPEALALLFERSDEIEAYYHNSSEPDRRPYNVVDGVALVPVTGLLIKGQAPARRWWTGYQWLADTVRAADADPTVREVLLQVDSPGGMVCGGLPVAVEAIEGLSKPCSAHISGLACSAAMPIVFAAGRGRVSASPMASGIGCLGAMMTIRKLEIDGFRIVEHRFVSKDTPRKNAPADTPEGAEDRQKLVDDHGETFLRLVGRLRGVGDDPAAIAQRYGEGRTVSPAEALEMGLIDSIRTNVGGVAGSNPSGTIAASEDTMKDSPENLLAAALAARTTAEAEAEKWRKTAETASAEADKLRKSATDLQAQLKAATDERDKLQADLATERDARLKASAEADFDRYHAAGDFDAEDREGFVEAHMDKARGDDRLWRFGFERRLGAGLAGIPGGANTEAKTHGEGVKPDANGPSFDQRIAALAEKTKRRPSEIVGEVEAMADRERITEAKALDKIEKRHS